MCHDNLQDYSYNIFIYGIFYTLTNDHHAAINYKRIALPIIQNGMQKVNALSVERLFHFMCYLFLVQILGKILKLKFCQYIKALNPWVEPLEMFTLVDALSDLIIFLKV